MPQNRNLHSLVHVRPTGSKLSHNHMYNIDMGSRRPGSGRRCQGPCSDGVHTKARAMLYILYFYGKTLQGKARVMLYFLGFCKETDKAKLLNNCCLAVVGTLRKGRRSWM